MANILLVEDDELIHQMILFRLQLHSHTIDSAYNGQEGYDMASQKKYDVILLDMHMPVMDGHETARKLREENYKGLIIAVTASVMTQETDFAINSGCNYFIPKPVGEDFEGLIEKYLNEFNA